MPHVVLLFEFPTRNGGENSILCSLGQLVREAQTAGTAWRFSALVPSPGRLSEALETLDIPVTLWSPNSAQGVKLPLSERAAALTATVRSLQPDLVHANSLSMSRVLGRATAQIGCPVSGHLRDIMRLSRASVEDLNRLDWLVAVSEATRAAHAAQGLDTRLCSVIHNGIEIVGRSLSPQVPSLRDQLRIPDSSTLLLNAGQLGLRKGQDTLLEAFQRVASVDPDCHLVLAGERHSQKQESREYESHLHELAGRDTCRGRVHFVGYLDRLSQVMPQFDLLVHTARQEPLGRVLLEAASRRLPIIATEAGGTTEIIEHESSGWLVPIDQPEALSAAILRMLHNRQLRSHLADAAYHRMAEHFSIGRATELLTQGWSRLLAQQPHDQATGQTDRSAH